MPSKTLLMSCLESLTLDCLNRVCSNISADDMLYTETDLEDSMEKIETINFHEVKEVAGIKFWCYHAGHVLGAAMFMIEIAGVKVSSSDIDPASSECLRLCGRVATCTHSEFLWTFSCSLKTTVQIL